MEFAVLGPLAAMAEGQPLPLRSTKQRILKNARAWVSFDDGASWRQVDHLRAKGGRRPAGSCRCGWMSPMWTATGSSRP